MTNAARIPNAPQYPCFSETYPGYEASSMFGIVISSKTPSDLVDKLSKDLIGFVKSSAFAAKAAALGMTPVGSTPAEFDQVIASEIEKWRGIATTAGIRLD